MTNALGTVSELRPSIGGLRSARAKHVHGLLTDERWSIRQAALRMGINHTVLASRMKGETPFLADEIESIAELLKRDAVDFYREYLSVGTIAPEPQTKD